MANFKAARKFYTLLKLHFFVIKRNNAINSDGNVCEEVTIGLAQSVHFGPQIIEKWLQTL